ncbi:DNA polymerase IV [Pleomorphomonas sp. T1.2MG-36]|uniref:DNA polymerase IV n=1 Tax=Pleomorphomonas sp. T1.2MG-36 TaxID=3041167 RepID=UPI002477C877|nr:DNA polymerase IV [Pleomorphomonas sp. T1.2MG-36]CAI9410379.1 DNA polymerase IV [Pleomorphomonas sp. T1.2MG-36]
MSEASIGFCKDCLAPAPAEGRRCPACGGPRLLRHPELHRLVIAHVDCDAFYASVEKRDDPSLASKPLIIGGGKRGVVSTACYIARISGVRSAMPMFKALQLCPDAVVIRPNMEKYARVGREIRRRMLELTPLVEPLSIDEAFLDLSGTEKLHRASPALVLARFAREVEREVGITVSVGLAANKFLAKIASDLDKPRGFSVIGQTEAAAFLAPRPVTTIWGVGRAFSERLAADGFRTVGDLQTADPARLASRYGALGLRIVKLSHGEDNRHVVPNSKRKSVGSEVTFFEDLADVRDLRPILREQAERVSFGLKHEDIAGSSVTLKLKTADFKLRTRTRRLADPTQLADRIFAAADALLAEEAHGQKYRLLGVAVADLCESRFADPADLVDQKAMRKAAAERAMDEVRQKFGKRALETGLVFDNHRRNKE